eukprot:m.7809 g.7809  ORF g.7809 m.7809 type:complete len:52 (-) comp3776_c0_seq1:2737-2892(-)
MMLCCISWATHLGRGVSHISHLGNKSLLKNEQAMQAHSLFAGAGMFIAGYC